jgi:methyl-accepting chemotaxis protein
VNQAVGEMDKVTQQNAASAEESSSAASELSGQAEELAAMVGAFSIERSQRVATVRPTAHAGASVARKAALPARPARQGVSPRNGRGLPPPDSFPMDEAAELKDF